MSSLIVVPTIATQWAAMALMVFDTMLTLDQEIVLVWKSQWSVPKALYLLIRSVGLAWVIVHCCVSLASRSPHLCSILNILNTTWLFITAAAGDALFMLRVLALLVDKPRWCHVLRTLYGVIYSVIFMMLCYDLSRSPILPFDAVGNPNLGCTAINLMQSGITLSETILPIATAPILLFNVLLLLIVLYKIQPQYRPTSDLHTPLLTVIVRDGEIYFVIMCSCLTFVAITPVALWSQPTMSMMSLSPFMAISALAACRLFLNLRAKAAKPSTDSILGITSPLDLNDFTNTSPGLSTSREVGPE